MLGVINWDCSIVVLVKISFLGSSFLVEIRFWPGYIRPSLTACSLFIYNLLRSFFRNFVVFDPVNYSSCSKLLTIRGLFFVSVPDLPIL